MKKEFIFCFVASVFVGCSSDNNITEETSDLVPAVIEISNGEEAPTRSYLGFTNSAKQEVPVLFEAGDNVVVVDGYAVNDFTVDNDGSRTYMSGSWGIPSKYPTCFAFIPKEAIQTGKEDDPLVVVSSGGPLQPTVHFYLPVDQTPRDLTDDKVSNKDQGISYQKNAGLAFSCPTLKYLSFNFIPIVSFLYFYSASPTCEITSDQKIAGNYDFTYTADKGTDMSGYGTASSLWKDKNALSFEASSKTIRCNGKKIKGHESKGDYYEYLIAIKPDKHYAAETGVVIHVGNSTTDPTGFRNKVEVNLAPNSVYYLGLVDPDPAGSVGAPARGVERTTLPFGR